MANTRFFIEPATATMHTQRKWADMGVDEDDLIEVTPQVNHESEEVTGFGIHLDLRQLPKFKVLHPIIEQMLAETTKHLVIEAMRADDDDTKDQLLWQAKELSTIMLNYYEHKENPEVTPEVSAEIERAIAEARNATKQ
jgi:hypothetical protein